MTHDTPTISMSEILDRYEAIFFDAYGVLVHDDGPIPGADALIEHLESYDRPYYILTNDASRSPQECSERYAGYGIPIPVERVISSGSLIGEHFSDHGLTNPRALVLGGPSAVSFVESLGATIVAPSPQAEFDVVIPCGAKGYSFIDSLDDTLSALYRRLDRGDTVHLLLPNPDVIYPRAEGSFGFTAGGIALLLEAALETRYPKAEWRFTHLGKPGAPIFESALSRVGTRNVIMIGDQLGTDIAGANAAGIDSALVSTGVAGVTHHEHSPTWMLPSLSR